MEEKELYEFSMYQNDISMDHIVPLDHEHGDSDEPDTQDRSPLDVFWDKVDIIYRNKTNSITKYVA